MPRRPGVVSPAQRNPLPLPAVHLATEFSPTTVAAQLRSGRWTRVRPGAFVETTALAGLDPHDRERAFALARVVAAHRTLRVPHVVSHVSAAVLHGLPLLGMPPVTHLTQESRRSGDASADLVRHRTVLDDGHVTTHRGLRVTTLERTVVDCAELLPVRAGLVVADAALHQGADPEVIAAFLADRGGRRGVRRARTVMKYADGGAESAGETLTRYVVLRAGLPLPTTQLEVRTRTGTYWTDLGWEEERVALEYDGEGKYLGAAGAHELRREKTRHDSLTEVGYWVGRVVGRDVRSPGDLIPRVARALGVDPPRVRAELA